MARVVITGCSTGIGRAAAVELHARGHHVIATARRVETLQDLEVADRLALDVTDESSVDAFMAACGPVDVLVNNAGLGLRGPIEKVPLDAVERLFSTNVFGAVRMMQAVLPTMREAGGGVIVNVTSVAGLVSSPLSGFYAATKFALEALSEGLHLEMNHFGVRVVMIEPGFITTEFSANLDSHGEDEPPYDELRNQWDAAQDALAGGQAPPGPELVGRAIADAVENEDTPLRVPVGDDAQLIVATRRALDDAGFEATMRETLSFDW